MTHMRTREHLQEWLKDTNRRWIVLRAEHLVDALAFPEETETLSTILAAYAAHRETITTGGIVTREAAIAGKEIPTKEFLGGQVHETEIDDAIAFLNSLRQR